MNYKKMSIVTGIIIIIGMIFMQVYIFHRKPISDVNTAKTRVAILTQNLKF